MPNLDLAKLKLNNKNDKHKYFTIPQRMRTEHLVS